MTYKQFKYTPGPWTTEPCSNGGRIVIRNKAGEGTQTHIQVFPEADAYLMAAAAELFKAALYFSICDFPDELRFKGIRCDSCIAGEKAITKAEGRGAL